MALTGQAQEEDRRRCLEAGMDAFLTKPLSQKELLALLADHSRERPVDYTKVLNRFDGDPEILEAAVSGFLDEAPPLLQKVRESSQTEDLKELAEASRRLRSALSIFGEGPCYQSVDALHKRVREDNLIDHDECRRLYQSFQSLQYAVENWPGLKRP